MILVHARTAARFTLRGVFYLLAYVVLGTLTSFVAAVGGTLILCAIGLGAEGIVGAAIMPPILMIGVPVGFLLSMPLTFVVFPGITLLLKRYPAWHLLALGLIGVLAGTVTGWWWASHTRQFAGIAVEFAAAAGAAGMIAGMMYAALVRSTRR